MTDGAAALLARFGAPDACAARLLCDDHPPGDLAFTIAEPDLTARDLTFGELEAESAAFAAALADLGIGPGDRVGVLMSRSTELLVTLLGIWRRGAVLVPLSTALGRPGIALRLRASTTTSRAAAAPSSPRVRASRPTRSGGSWWSGASRAGVSCRSRR